MSSSWEDNSNLLLSKLAPNNFWPYNNSKVFY